LEVLLVLISSGFMGQFCPKRTAWPAGRFIAEVPGPM
jgi:hypothetical protein